MKEEELRLRLYLRRKKKLSRARRVAENAFGILAARFWVFHTCMGILPAHATKVVQACVVLHNYLKVSADDMPEIENDPPCPLRDLQRRALGNRAPNMAAQVRNKFKGLEQLIGRTKEHIYCEIDLRRIILVFAQELHLRSKLPPLKTFVTVPAFRF